MVAEDHGRHAGDDPGELRARSAAALGLYRRLSTLETDGEIDSFGAELIDRFGPLPSEVEQLLKIVAIKALCRRANVEKVDGGPKGIIVSFRDNSFANPTGLVRYIAEQASFAKVRPGHEDRLHPRCGNPGRAPQDGAYPAGAGALAEKKAA